VATYIAAMAASSRIGRVLVERQAVASGGPRSTRVMVAPVPLTPIRRAVVRDIGLSYEIGTFTWSLRPRYEATGEHVPTLRDTTIVTVAEVTSTRAGRKFVAWSRFPFPDVVAGDSSEIRLDDARYAPLGRRSFASVTIPRSRPPAAR